MDSKNYPNASRVFSELAIKTTFDDLDAPLLERMKIRLADSLGCTAAGFHGVGIDMVLRLLQEYGGREESSVFNFGDKMPAAHAAFINSLQMRSNDFEPAHAGDKTGKGRAAHITGSIFPTAFAMGERMHASGKEIMTAIAVGEDLGCRLCHAMGFSVDGVFDGNGTLNVMAVTACAAKLAGMNAEQIHNAFSIALNTMGGAMASTKEHSLLFKFPIANSARNGIFAADMARHGYTGLEDPILGKGCFMDMYALAPEMDMLFDDLGKVLYGEVLIKPYSGCCATHHSIKSALQATGGRPYSPEEVREIRVHMLASKVRMVGGIWEPGENSQPFASFSCQATVCNAVLHGCVFPEHETPEVLAGETFQAMLTKYRQVTDLKEDDEYIAKVEVELMDGTVLSGQCNDIRPGNMTDVEPLSLDYIHNKFSRNMKFGGKIPMSRSEEIWEICMNFEQLDSIERLTKLMVP